MTHQAPFTMRVADVFHLEDGRTVFVGEILSSPLRIKEIQCQLVVDGRVRDHFELEGEVRFSPNQTTHRAISAIKSISISSDEIKDRQCTLSGYPPIRKVLAATRDLATS